MVYSWFYENRAITFCLRNPTTVANFAYKFSHNVWNFQKCTVHTTHTQLGGRAGVTYGNNAIKLILLYCIVFTGPTQHSTHLNWTCHSCMGSSRTDNNKFNIRVLPQRVFSQNLNLTSRAQNLLRRIDQKLDGGSSRLTYINCSLHQRD